MALVVYTWNKWVKADSQHVDCCLFTYEEKPSQKLKQSNPDHDIKQQEDVYDKNMM